MTPTCRRMMMGAMTALLALSASAATDIPSLDWQPRSDWVNVRELGAVGDGLANDTAALQRALDGVQNGSAVYLPPGTYRVTETLTLTGPFIGVLVVGHGRDTTLLWDGEAGGRLLVDDGVAYSRYVGLTLDGQEMAAFGLFHHSDNRFETEVRHQHLAFRGFTDTAIYADPDDSYALAETNYENCLFEDCGRGVALVSFNDYNHTFDGCEFRRCDVGIDCSHGNFFARNTHFEGSRTVDIRSAPEHACSVRRCTSVGSAKFLDHRNSVSSMTVQDCHVSGWTGEEGAVTLAGAPCMVFDCVFTDPPNDSAPLRLPKADQRLIVSENRAEGARSLLPSEHQARVYEVPAGERSGSIQSAKRTFLSDTATTPGRVFDAREDFGAIGDGRTDDAAAIQAAIDAAREHGEGAIAYLPGGNYAIGTTIQVSGADYVVSGGGFMTRLRWLGDEDGTMVAVRDAWNVTLQHLAIGLNETGAQSGIDVHQTGGGEPSVVIYDGVAVYGQYAKQPFRQGLWFSDLEEHDVVLLKHAQGNMRFTNCGEATILGNTTFEGSITVEGDSDGRTGFLGFLTRLATIVTHGLYLRGNHSIVMSDFYVEQAENGFVFEGSGDRPYGRATIQGAKLHFLPNEQNAESGTAMTIRDYAGEIFFGPDQLYVEPERVSIRHRGAAPLDLFLLGNCFYRTFLDAPTAESMQIFLIGNEAVGVIEEDVEHPARWEASDSFTPDALEHVSHALDDLRRLGEIDLRLNHGEP
ncbi:MAG: glycosyl hydrolase family 28-related protein [Armatimonadota bacterium]